MSEPMKWRDELPDDWVEAPDAPPVRDAGTIGEPLEDGVVIRDREDGDQYVYAGESVARDAGHEGIPSV